MSTPLPPPPPAGSSAIRAKMQAQRVRDTTPEVALRRELHRRGVRFRLGGTLPGLPRRSADIAWVRRKVAVFVDGCYWHGCPEHFHVPKTNTGWWLAKIQRNQARDQATTASLEAQGWKVLRIWEHEDTRVAADRVVEALRGRGGRPVASAGLEPASVPGEVAGIGDPEGVDPAPGQRLDR